MANFKCKMCGAPLEVKEGQTVAVCSFCGSKQTVANANDERKENLFNRANALRQNCEFDKAILSYQSILSIFPNEPEAHWGLCLCKYGIEYVDDPVTKCKKPTVHRASFKSILKDSDYLAALSYADVIAKEEYQTEATEIANIQKNILSISQKEDPFDIFICYKESDENGKRTMDSVIAHDIYDQLVDKGYKVFFARVTLENKLGTMYEPYIFAALNSAKIMLVIGTKKEYFESIWVKNEWSRFIDLMKVRTDRYLIPCFKDINAYEMPEEFLSFQAQDLSKLGYMQDLVRGINKIMGKESIQPRTETRIIQTDVNVEALLKRSEILISDGNYDKADELLERVLDNDPTNSQAYILKLLIELNLRTIDELKEQEDTLERYSNYQKAYDFAEGEQKRIISSINETIEKRNEEARLSRLYDIAMDYKNNQQYSEAEKAFSEIAGFKDATKQAAECVKLGKEDIYKRALLLKENKEYDEAIETFTKIEGFKDSKKQIEKCLELKNTDLYKQALALKEQGDFDAATSIFMEILSFNDSDYQIDECARLKLEAQKEAIYKTCLFDRDINVVLDGPKLKKACEALAQIRGYKDSDQLLVKYEGMVKEYEANQENKREIRRRQQEKKKKRIKKISIISAISATVLTGVLLLTFLFLVPKGREGNIQSLIDQKKYQEAYALIENNGSFGDSSNLLQMCKAGEAFDALDYEKGIDLIYNIGGTVDVSYDGNGGTAQKNHEVIKKLMAYIDNDPIKPGYTFHGWVLNTYSMSAASHYASIELKASYDVVTYNISYNLDGGTSTQALPSTYTTETEVELPNPSKIGYTFIGWTSNNIEDPIKNYTIPLGSIGNKAFTANWEANDYTIYLNPNGGNVDKTEIEATFDSNFLLPTPIYEGYDFLGWYDNNSTLYVSGKYVYPNDLYLNAVWRAHGYSIMYNLNGGTNNPSNPNEYNKESSTITLKDPTRKGYTFIGWTNNIITKPSKNVSIPSGSIGNLTFNANWIANDYTVTINLNGGYCDKTSYTFTYDQSYQITEPSKVGYTFANFTAKGNQVATTGIWKIDEDVTLLTNWIANTNTKYVVNHYIENLNDDKYTKFITENFTGTSDSKVTVVSKDFEGFTPVEASKEITIAADGSTVVDLYYTRNSYALTFVTNGGNTIEEMSYKYEQQMPETLVPTRMGFTFGGWYIDVEQTTLFTKMPAHNLTVYAYYNEEVKASHFACTLFSNSAKITKANGLSGDIVIPEYIAGKQVTQIGDGAFLYCNAITSIEFSPYVNDFGNNTFKGCSSLEKISGPLEITSISDGLFEDCVSLSTLPDLTHVIFVGNNAFKNCYLLTSIDTAKSLQYVGNYAFQNCVMLLETPNLENVSYIGDYAFENCTLLTEIKGLDGCATLGEGILTACENIAKLTITFKSNIEQFYMSNLFNGNFSLDKSKYYEVSGENGTKHYIPNKLNTIDAICDGGKIPAYFLYQLSSITNVRFNEAPISTINQHAFDGCNNLSDLLIMNNQIEIIENYAFNNCVSLSTIPALNLTTNIGDYAFANCSSLIDIGPLDNIDNVGKSAFENCKLLKAINISNSTSLGIDCLKGCSNLEELALPFTGTSINSTLGFGIIFGKSFYDNSYVVRQKSSTYYIPNSLKVLSIGGTSIKANTINDLTSIENLIISDSITQIAESSLSGLSSLKSITLPFIGSNITSGTVFGFLFGTNGTGSGKTSEGGRTYQIGVDPYNIPSSLINVNITKQQQIPFRAFYNCDLIKYINIPTNVDLIGESAFGNCTNLIRLNSSIDGEVNIPENVSVIKNHTFDYCSSIKKITFSNNVKRIENYVFLGCTMITSINSETVGEIIIHEPCEYIGNSAFEGLGLITNIKIPDTVNEIGTSVLKDCNSLESINVPFVGRSDSSVGNYGLFGYFFATNNDSIPTTLTNVVITRQTNIPTNAFYKCSNIKSITIPNDVETINQGAFSNCTNLIRLNSSIDGEVNIPEKVKEISIYMFDNCPLIQRVILNNNIEKIDSYAFRNCAMIQLIASKNDLSENQNEWKIVIPHTCEYIGMNAFEGLSLINNVIVSDSVLEIGTAAFKGLNSLESITLPFVGTNENATGNNGRLNTMFGVTADNMPETLKNIIITKQKTLPQDAFSGCDKVENIKIPEDITKISRGAFYKCSNLKTLNSNTEGTVNIPLNVTIIDTYAFYNCPNIQIITIGKNINRIGDYAFEGCSLLNSFNSESGNEIIIPDECEYIGASAFKDAGLITNVFVPDSVLEIQRGAFRGLNSLEKITLPFIGKSENSTTLYEAVFGYIFDYISGGTGGKTSAGGLTWQSSGSYYYYIPQSLSEVSITRQVNIPRNSFYNCDLIKNLHFVNCIKSTGSGAFTNCTATIDYEIEPKMSGPWNGSDVSNEFHGGSGTKTDPYQIFFADEFIYLLNQIRNGTYYDNTYFLLTSDINISSNTIQSIATTNDISFNGVLDGNGHKIRGVSLNLNEDDFMGLFGIVKGTIKNISFQISATCLSTLTTDVYVGSIVGKLEGSLENVYVEGTITATSARTIYVGGFVGQNIGTIINCYTNIDINGISNYLKCYAAGLVGYNDGKISGSFAYGNVSSKGYVESYSFPSGLVADEGPSSIVVNSFRCEGQEIKIFSNIVSSYNQIGTLSRLDEIITYCKANWDNNRWSFEKTLPFLKIL